MKGAPVGQKAGDTTEPADLRRALARELAAARNQADVSQAQLAEAVGYSPAIVATAEAGDADVDRGFWTAADQALAAGGSLTALHDRIRQAPAPAPAVTPAGTISGVMTDLALIKGRLLIGPDRIERTASMLDQLSQELAEAAQVLRQG